MAFSVLRGNVKASPISLVPPIRVNEDLRNRGKLLKGEHFSWNPQTCGDVCRLGGGGEKPAVKQPEKGLMNRRASAPLILRSGAALTLQDYPARLPWRSRQSLWQLGFILSVATFYAPSWSHCDHVCRRYPPSLGPNLSSGLRQRWLVEPHPVGPPVPVCLLIRTRVGWWNSQAPVPFGKQQGGCSKNRSSTSQPTNRPV